MTPRALGQHFLVDPEWRARILERMSPRRDQVWVEIGAGRGEMTRELARRVRRVVAIEMDTSLLEPLRRQVRDLPVEIVCGNALRLDLASLGGARFRVYGSLPYYITSPILRRLFAIADHIEEIDVVIQREVAERVAARPGTRDYGWFSLLAQFYTRPEIVLQLPPGAFRPPPKVHSALLKLRPPGEKARLGIDGEERFLEFAEACFAQKRKTLVNNLKARYGAARVREGLAELRMSPQARAEELSLLQFADLFRKLGTTTLAVEGDPPGRPYGR